MNFYFKGFCFFSLVFLWSFFIWGSDDFYLGKNFTRENLNFSIIFTDRNDLEIYRTFDKENREWTKFSEIPDFLKKATLLAEDQRFYFHPGIDFIGILRAGIENVKAGKIVQGASTITQQLARKVFLTDQKTFKRKIREMFIAFGIESKYSKDEIFEMYLNTVPYGARVNGVKVASEYYFKKLPAELTEGESLILALLPQNPVLLSQKTKIKDWLGKCETDDSVSGCSPFYSENYELSKLEKLLFSLAQSEKWTSQKTQEVWETLAKIELPKQKNWVHSDFQHFRFFVQDFLEAKGFDTTNNSGGIIVKTTLDSTLQKEVYEMLRTKSGELFEKHNMKNFSVMILDNEERAPLVWIGSKYFWNNDISGQVDMLRSRRQTGSAIKPFIYSAVIDEGFEPPTIFYDSVVQFQGDSHRLSNSDGHFLGGIRMTDALAKSRNIPAAKSVIFAGGEKKVKTYLDENFSFEINKNFKNHFFGWTLALGTAPVRLMDLVNGYATIATTENREICPISEIRSFAGERLENPCEIMVRSKMKKTTAFFISDILQNKDARPLAWRERLTLEKNFAVKTGTSSKRVLGTVFPVDNIVVGYNPKSTVFFWGGNTDGEGMKRGTVAVYSVGKVWKSVTEKFLEKYPEKYAEFEPPPNLKKINGEWASLDYVPPSYDVLSGFVLRNTEKGLNPLFQLETEKGGMD